MKKVEKVPIRVAPGVSSLTSGILRAALYPDDKEAERGVVAAYGSSHLARAREVLQRHYRVDHRGVLVTDCPVRVVREHLPGSPPPSNDLQETPIADDEFRICPSDHRRHAASLYRCGAEDGSGEVLPAFPHGAWSAYDADFTLKPMPASDKIRVGFCGMLRPGVRRDAVDELRRLAALPGSRVVADVVERERFAGGELPPDVARREYVDVIERNAYQLCPRGVGNYSYRTYETMSMGRVPIVFGKASMPFPEMLQWRHFDKPRDVWDHLFVTVDEPKNLGGILESRHEDVMKMNGRYFSIWDMILSPVGWWAHAAERIFARLVR